VKDDTDDYIVKYTGIISLPFCQTVNVLYNEATLAVDGDA